MAHAKAGESSIARYARTRSLRRCAIVAATVAVLMLLMAADRRGWLLYGRDDATRYHGKWFEVVEAIDGDTLTIRVVDRREPVTSVRLWGVVAPAMGRDAASSQPFADEAVAMVANLAAGQRVRLWLEPHRTRDEARHLIAYVQLADGAVLNEQLLAAGLADLDHRYTHRQMERYSRLCEQARHDQKGQWRDLR